VADLHAPSLVGGRYELGAVLGTGGTARVHRGTDLVLRRSVAIKLFRADVEFHDAARVQTEGRTLAALNHPGLVGVYDAGTVQTPWGVSPYLVMELVDGPSLAFSGCDGSLPIAEVARIGAELADALRHVHERGIVHRDIKPGNILLDQDGRPKITDFGIARMVDSARHTATGLTIGTAAYLSPEQLSSDPVGAPSDVYSLGLVLLECLTGHREYPGTGAESAFARLHRAPVVPVNLPAPWRQLLTAMTDSDPTRRPTAADVAASLRREPEAATGSVAADPAPTALITAVTRQLQQPPASTTLPMTLPGPARRGRRRTALAASVAALVAVIALLAATTGILATGSGPTTPSPTTNSSTVSPLSRDLTDLQRAVTP
jgi:eukaryotic-like serine/threonine-protein kinase